MVGCKDESLIDDVVDSDYGVWDAGKKCFWPIIRKGITLKSTKVDKLTQTGIYDSFECLDENVSSVEVLVYQRNLTGEHKLGTIIIPNPGSKKYKIYMQVEKKKGILQVVFYDIVKKTWIDEIPLNQREFRLI